MKPVIIHGIEQIGSKFENIDKIYLKATNSQTNLESKKKQNHAI